MGKFFEIANTAAEEIRSRKTAEAAEVAAKEIEHAEAVNKFSADVEEFLDDFDGKGELVRKENRLHLRDRVLARIDTLYNKEKDAYALSWSLLTDRGEVAGTDLDELAAKLAEYLI